jgi:hypothetical protein
VVVPTGGIISVVVPTGGIMSVVWTGGMISVVWTGGTTPDVDAPGKPGKPEPTTRTPGRRVAELGWQVKSNAERSVNSADTAVQRNPSQQALSPKRISSRVPKAPQTWSSTAQVPSVGGPGITPEGVEIGGTTPVVVPTGGMIPVVSTGGIMPVVSTGGMISVVSTGGITIEVVSTGGITSVVVGKSGTSGAPTPTIRRPGTIGAVLDWQVKVNAERSVRSRLALTAVQRKPSQQLSTPKRTS